MIAIKKFGDNPNLTISGSSGSFSSSSSSFVTPTNLSFSFTTHGFPVMLFLQDDGSGSQSKIEADSNTGNDTAIMETAFFQDSTQLTYTTFHVQAVAANNPQISLPASSFQYVYVPSPGTYTYAFKIRFNNLGSGDSGSVTRVKLVALEIGY